MLLFEGSIKMGFLDIYLTTVFRAPNFENTSAMRVTFFKKCSKFYRHFENAEKNREKFVVFRDDCISIGCVKVSLLRREYLWRALSVLKNSPNILLITKRDFFQTQLLLQWSVNMVKMASFRFQQCLIPFTMLLVEGSSQTRLLDIFLTTFFAMYNFGNTLAMTVIFFWRCAEFYLSLKNAEKHSEKVFLFEIIASKLAVLISLY